MRIHAPVTTALNGRIAPAALSIDRLDSLTGTVGGLLNFRGRRSACAAVICCFAWSATVSAQQPAEPAVAAIATDSALAAIELRLAALEREKSEFEEKLALLERSNQELKASDRQSRQMLRILTSAGKSFSRNLARRTLDNVSRRIAGMPGAAIPHVGAGVLVGMTAMDVREGCETLEELNELLRTMDQETVDASRVCTMRVPTSDEVLARVISNWRTAYAIAAARANQYEIRIPPDPPSVPYASASELWVAVFGVSPGSIRQSVPAGFGSPLPPIAPTPPTPPTMTRP